MLKLEPSQAKWESHTNRGVDAAHTLRLGIRWCQHTFFDLLILSLEFLLKISESLFFSFVKWK